MKKTARILAMLLAFFCITSCGTTNIPADETTVAVESERGTEAETEPILIEEGINADKINIERIEGLNEQIYIQLEKTTAMLEDFSAMDFKVSYRAMDEAEFTELDKELYLDEDEYVGCYILGLPKGQYCVKIECGEGDEYACITILDIDVEKQDRSGYAHFNREEGIGGYNNDGSVKDNAVILYVNNENKNTVTLDIDGTTYTGLVQILQAKQYMEEPLIVRVTDKITTNQWMEKNSGRRLADGSMLAEDYFENTFSTEYGENLINLPTDLYDRKEGVIYSYLTTVDGVVGPEVREGTKKVDNEGGVEYYEDGTDINRFRIFKARDFTIEGVGMEAGFFQFGIQFMYCQSVEIRNLTFDQYPEDGLDFFGDHKSPAKSGGYWIHNNTFEIGYCAWRIVSDKKDGDGALDFNGISRVTISYNKFNNCAKTMLIGYARDRHAMDITLHHNYYHSCSSRLPLVRNANVHMYNNLFFECYAGVSPRGEHLLILSEANSYINCNNAYYISGSEEYGVVKSYGDFYEFTGARSVATKVSSRDEYVENTCKPDGVTDYSHFDTDPELFYYDAENKCSDVEVMLDGEAVLEFVKTYAGAGAYVRLDIPYSVSETVE